MFTGIIEAIGTIRSIENQNANLRISIESSIASSLHEGQSVNHNGVCLTVTSSNTTTHEVIAVSETIGRSNLGYLQVGDVVNLERAMSADARFDGHIVQGHVDDVIECLSIEDRNGSHQFWFRLNERELLIMKGSVALDGVSLTVSDLRDDAFAVDIIPFTLEHTTFRNLKPGMKVNVEYDVLGKYVRAALSH